MIDMLFGMQLSVEVPAKVLELVGNIEKSDEVDGFLKELLGQFYDQFDYRYIIIPNIISGMVESDVSFEQSAIFSQDTFDASIKDMVDKLGDDTGLKQMLFMGMRKLLKSAKMFQDQAKESDGIISVILPRMSSAFYHGLLKQHDLVTLAEKISKDEKIRDVLKTRFVDPLKQPIREGLEKIANNFNEELDEEDICEIESQFDVCCVSLTLSKILSVVLTEAINDGISFSEALNKLGVIAVVKQVDEKLMAIDDLSVKTDELGDLVGSILPPLDA